MNLTIEKALQRAISAHQAGKLHDAKEAYQVILQAQPLHPDANHNLGVLLVSLFQLDAALPLFKVALDVNPSQGQYWLSYIDALIKVSQFDNAKKLLKEGKSRGLAGEQVDELSLRLAPQSKELQQNKIQSPIFSLQRKKFSEKKEKKKSLTALQGNSVQKNLPSQDEVNFLLTQYQNGQYEVAEKLALDMTKKHPNHQFGWKVIGAVYSASGKLHDAVIAIQKAISCLPNDAEAHYNLGITLNDLGQLRDAEKSYRQAIALKPDYVESHINLGNALKDLGQLRDAEKSYRQAIALKPDYTEAHYNLGITLHELNHLEDAEISYRQAIVLKPDFVEAYYNLGKALKDLGNPEDATVIYRKAIVLKPDFAEAHSNLGNALKDLGRLEEAEKCYRKAIALKPDFAEAYYNLGITLEELGRFSEAFDLTRALIKIKPTADGKNSFVKISQSLAPTFWDKALAEMVVVALVEPWGRPIDAMGFACRLLKLDAGFISLLNQANESVNQSEDASFLGSFAAYTAESSPLLHAMLSSSHIPDYELEQLFTRLRRYFMMQVSLNMSDLFEGNDVPVLYCHLAQQCFINEYVYFQTEEEINGLQLLFGKLAAALDRNEEIPAALVIVVACYVPLHSVLGAEALLHRQWPFDVASVLKQQIQEPLYELALRTSIPSLTSTENIVSLEVQRMYEENPYPRWARLPKETIKRTLDTHIRALSCSDSLQPLVDNKSPKILIAGCGTGQHPISTAQLIEGASVLAIDLSMASLAYARRKTDELGIKNIKYAQADLLKLGSLDRTFDVIESSGVLHHLENPFEGWEVLLSLLKPHGLMRLGFYSMAARGDIITIRNMIAEAGIGSSAQEIRAYRKRLMKLEDSDGFGMWANNGDFFSTSTCRDLLFHVQEHQMTIPTLSNFFKQHDLNFLGFDIDSLVVRAYKNRFPNDPSVTNLDQWHIYEEENPNTFIGMYQFWVQKQH